MQDDPPRSPVSSPVGIAPVGVASGAGLARWLRRGGKLPDAPKPWETR